MKRLFFLFLALFWITSCKQEQKKSLNTTTIISSRVNFEEKGNTLVVKSGKFSYIFEENELPLHKIVLLNSSLLGYFLELNAENLIIGVSSPEYIFSEKVKNLIKEGKIQDVGNEQKYNIEKILALKPDAIFTNYVPSFENTYQILKNNGIKVIFIDEYLEQKPLEKSAYLKLFGKLLGKEKEADTKFVEIERNYKALEKLALTAKSNPYILSNEMYGDVWYLPGGKTFTANYISDANGKYILEGNIDDKAVPTSFEEVFVLSKNTNIWVNAGNHTSKKDLLDSNALYAKLNVFSKGKIYSMNAKEKQKANDFFESGVVRADVVLKDYVKIFYPELLNDYQLTYMKELQ